MGAGAGAVSANTGGGIYPLTIRGQDVRKLPFVSKVLRTAQPPVRRREADAFPKMALVVLKPHENDFRSAKRDLGT